MRADAERPAPVLGSSSGAARAVAATSCESIPAADVLHITQTQAETHAMLRTANEQLAAFNDESGIAYASLSARFTEHARTMSTLQTELMGVFKRVKAVRQRLLQAHPELQAASDAADAAREAELEREPDECDGNAGAASVTPAPHSDAAVG